MSKVTVFAAGKNRHLATVWIAIAAWLVLLAWLGRDIPFLADDWEFLKIAAAMHSPWEAFASVDAWSVALKNLPSCNVAPTVAR